MNLISEKINSANAGFRYTPDPAIEMNCSGGTCFPLRIRIYILSKILSIVDLTHLAPTMDGKPEE